MFLTEGQDSEAFESPLPPGDNPIAVNNNNNNNYYYYYKAVLFQLLATLKKEVF